MRPNLTTWAIKSRQPTIVKSFRAISYSRISTSSAKPAFAVERTTRPAEQRFPSPPFSSSRDGGFVPELSRSTVTRQISELPKIEQGLRQISVVWNNGIESKFHHIWLRDHCRCSECLHPITKQRLVDTFKISPDIRPVRVESKPTGLEVTWPSSPPHVSVYPWEWLSQSSYDPRLNRVEHFGLAGRKTVWDSSIKESPPTVSYEEVMKDDLGVLNWLQKIDEFGVCFIEGVPHTPEATELLTRRISFIRETKYGGFWDFTADLKHGDTAYTNLALGAHTDTTYLSDPCGLQLFHLLSHEGTGGHTLLVDGFYAASLLRERYPSHFNLLAQVKISAHAAGDADSLYIPSEPFSILKLDASGRLIQVRYNNDDRSVLKHIDPELVDDWQVTLQWINTSADINDLV